MSVTLLPRLKSRFTLFNSRTVKITRFHSIKAISNYVCCRLVALSWLDCSDGDIIDRMRRLPRLFSRRKRQCLKWDAPQLCEQRWLGWFWELHMVTDEHEKDAGHGRTYIRVFLHAEQAYMVAPPCLFPSVLSPK